MSFSPESHVAIPWIQKTTVNILEAAASQKSVKRFVLTSSSWAVIIPTPNEEGVRVDESKLALVLGLSIWSDLWINPDTWNEASIKAAWDESTPAEEKPYHVYSAAKAAQEREAWKWVKEHRPGFQLNVVVPNTNVCIFKHSINEAIIINFFLVWQNPAPRNTRFLYGLVERCP